MDICVGYAQTASYNKRAFLMSSLSLENVDKIGIWTYQNQGIMGWVEKLQHLGKFLRECLDWRGGDIEFSFE